MKFRPFLPFFLLLLFSLFFVSAPPLQAQEDTAEISIENTGVALKVEPSGADVYIDNILLGKADPEFKKLNMIPDEMVTITLKKKDYYDLSFRIQVQPGISTYDRLEMTPTFGYFTLTGSPKGADVYLNNKQIGKISGLERKPIPSGSYLLTVRKPQYEPLIDKLIDIYDGEVTREEVALGLQKRKKLLRKRKIKPTISTPTSPSKAAAGNLVRGRPDALQPEQTFSVKESTVGTGSKKKDAATKDLSGQKKVTSGAGVAMPKLPKPSIAEPKNRKPGQSGSQLVKRKKGRSRASENKISVSNSSSAKGGVSASSAQAPSPFKERKRDISELGGSSKRSSAPLLKRGRDISDTVSGTGSGPDFSRRQRDISELGSKRDWKKSSSQKQTRRQTKRVTQHPPKKEVVLVEPTHKGPGGQSLGHDVASIPHVPKLKRPNVIEVQLDQEGRPFKSKMKTLEMFQVGVEATEPKQELRRRSSTVPELPKPALREPGTAWIQSSEVTDIVAKEVATRTPTREGQGASTAQPFRPKPSKVISKPKAQVSAYIDSRASGDEGSGAVKEVAKSPQPKKAEAVVKKKSRGRRIDISEMTPERSKSFIAVQRGRDISETPVRRREVEREAISKNISQKKDRALKSDRAVIKPPITPKKDISQGSSFGKLKSTDLSLKKTIPEKITPDRKNNLIQKPVAGKYIIAPKAKLTLPDASQPTIGMSRSQKRKNSTPPAIVSLKDQGKSAIIPPTLLADNTVREKVKKEDAVLAEKKNTILIPDRSVEGRTHYEPLVIRIKAGEQVTWVNEDTRSHFVNYKPDFSLYSSYGDDGDDDDDALSPMDATAAGLKSDFNSPRLNSGDTWTYTFKAAGTFMYYCFIHPLELVGKIIVE